MLRKRLASCTREHFIKIKIKQPRLVSSHAFPHPPCFPTPLPTPLPPMHFEITSTAFHTASPGAPPQHRPSTATSSRRCAKRRPRFPVVFGNLRQELISEREQPRRKIRPLPTTRTTCRSSTKGASRDAPQRSPRTEEVAVPVPAQPSGDLWTEFKNLERPFPRRGRAPRRDDPEGVIIGARVMSRRRRGGGEGRWVDGMCEALSEFGCCWW
jgi:hypothetical protein